MIKVILLLHIHKKIKCFHLIEKYSERKNYGTLLFLFPKKKHFFISSDQHFSLLPFSYSFLSHATHTSTCNKDIGSEKSS